MKLITLMLVGSLLSLSSNSLSTYSEISAPEISLANPQGKILNLSSLQGNIVLVDFWASWCSPCRKSRPGMVDVFNQFKDEDFKNAEGFEIYSVSLDDNKEKWMAAIEHDNLNWANHVSDLKAWNSVAAQDYGIRGIPSNVLLNEKGEIIAKNLFGDELKEVLLVLLENK